MPDLPSDKCKGVGTQASNGSILSSEEKQFFEQIADEVRKEKTSDNSETLSQRVALRTELGIKADKFKALQQKRAASINYLRRQDLNAGLSKWDDKIKGLNASLVGNDRVGKGIASGGRNSVAADHLQMFQSSIGTLKAKLGLKGLIKLFESKGATQGIMRELWRIGRSPEELKTMPEGGRPEYKEIAQYIHEAYSPLIDRANRAGAFINNLPGYIMRQSHDMDSIRKAGGEVRNTPEARAKNAQAWKSFIEPLLDWKKMEANEGKEIDRGDFLQSSWESLASGVHLKPTQENMDAGTSFKGIDLAGKVSSYRKLLFKDSDSFKSYNDKYGQKTLMDGVSSSIKKLSENVALMNKFGTNPENMFQSLSSSLQGETRLDFNDGKKWYAVERNWKYISGESRQPLNLSLAKIGSGIRAYQVLTSLGQALFSHTTDIAVGGPAELAYQGINPLTGFFKQITGAIAHVADKDKRMVAYRLGVGVEGWHSNFWSSFDGAQDTPGVFSKLAQSFYSINGERPWANAHQGAIATMMSNHLAELSQSNFDKLPEATKRLFGLYDIKPNEWESLRKNVESVNGTKYLMPDSVASIPDEEIAKMVTESGKKASEAAIVRYRDDLEARFRNHFIDRVDYANLRPGAREMSILHFGTRPGTPEGEAARFLAQFKAYPVAFFTKTLSRELYGRNSTAASMGALTTVAAAATVGGYAALTLGALASGKTPPDPTKWSTMEASMVKGGGMGILTDYIFGQGSIGRGPADAALGPTFGKAFNLLAMFQKAKEIGAMELNGEKSKGYASLKDDFSRNMQTLIPGQNLFYLKGLFQYQVVYRLNEMLNPGYLNRMQERMKSSGQQFFIPPN